MALPVMFRHLSRLWDGAADDPGRRIILTPGGVARAAGVADVVPPAAVRWRRGRLFSGAVPGIRRGRPGANRIFAPDTATCFGERTCQRWITGCTRMKKNPLHPCAS